MGEGDVGEDGRDSYLAVKSLLFFKCVRIEYFVLELRLVRRQQQCSRYHSHEERYIKTMC